MTAKNKHLLTGFALMTLVTVAATRGYLGIEAKTLAFRALSRDIIDGVPL